MFNSYHPRLQFTIEVETNNQLAYLDVNVIRNESTGAITTDWYQKDISSNRILNFWSSHHFTQKINTAKNLIHRTLTLSSDMYHKNNIQKIKHILHINNYPQKIVHRLITAELTKIRTQSDILIDTHNNSPNTQFTDNTKLTYKSMTYINGVSEKIEKVLKSHNNDLRIAYRSDNCVRKIFSKLKEQIPVTKKTNVIYKIPCGGGVNDGSTCHLSYVGQTKQYLGKRLQNHKRDVQKLGDQNAGKTALMDHCHSNDHYPDFAAATILATQKHYSKRLTLEALHIYSQTTMNIKQDTDNIAAVYCGLINDNKKIASKRKRTPHTHTNITHEQNINTEAHTHINNYHPPAKKRKIN